jgi:hypothetical protein
MTDESIWIFAIYIIDLMIAVAAVTSGWLWYKASRRRVQRVYRSEVLDAADINRIVTSINRTQILNARAAMATAIAAGLGILRYAVSYSNGSS